MEVLIVTGMSGAGKSKAIDALEDIGFFCVDNIPPKLVLKFVDLCKKTNEIDKIAIVSDARGGHMVSSFIDTLDELTEEGINFRVLFLDASDNKLMTRYKETRRRHPLLDNAEGSIENAITMERKLLGPIKELSEIIVDTSLLSPTQLKNRIDSIFLEENQKSLFVNCMSFGFKYGIPSEADLVFDVRCLPNPFYIPDLKGKTGLQSEVSDYVLSFKESSELLARLKDLIIYLLPLYQTEGKSQLVIAIGCTGGKHRSVTFAEQIYKYLIEKDCKAITTHRDITKE